MNEEEIIITVKRLEENKTGVQILKDVYTYEMVNVLTVLLNIIFKNNISEQPTEDEIDSMFDIIKKEYKEKIFYDFKMANTDEIGVDIVDNEEQNNKD